MKLKKSAEDKMIFLYRYVSLSLTSLVFLFESSRLNVWQKLLLIVFLFLSVTLFTWIYRKYRLHDMVLKCSIALETAGIILLLLPTGGMDSPFKWYVITPMLVACAHLSMRYSWTLLLSYIGLVLTFCYIFFTPGQYFLWDMVLQNANLFLVLIVTTMAMQVIGVMKNELKMAKEQANETMEHIKSIYHIMETTSHNEALNLGQVISDYTVKLTKQSRAFFWLDSQEEDAPESSQTGWTVEEEEQLFEELGNYREEFREEREPFFRHLPEWGDFLMITVPMTTRFVATIGLKLGPDQSLTGRRWLVQQLIFLAELSAVFLERYELERIENQLIVTNEQNRIANEMHDNVSQSLFGIVYATHSLRQTWHDQPKEQVEEQIELIQQSANQAVRELKGAIHSLSSKKSGGPTWLGTVKSHLHTLSKLNHVQIDFDIHGDHFSLPYLYQKALFRIISEAAGNAIRHGLAKRVDVKLKLTPQVIRLSIHDDGVGFETARMVAGGEAVSAGSGLGMMNMEYLAQSMGGEFDISSRIGEGTQIRLSIPVNAYE
ncbi:sensor histidine kinase [Paenibacillus sp. 8b26]|uniref:sensor histidine kinase n=1 Tax=Paenibacillus sp. 8b26 TaxID=3424133 RepID=UPI003D6504D8